ncbi:MAG: hypothetical protein WC393_00500 [Candidatus Nanoarchaeia archaeon]|jgi:hypothetical protein
MVSRSKHYFFAKKKKNIKDVFEKEKKEKVPFKVKKKKKKKIID